MWLENDESVIMGDNIMSASSDVQSTSLSDDIELGAVCSQSWALQINDAETRFLGKEYDLSLYLADLTGVTTYSTPEASHLRRTFKADSGADKQAWRGA